MGQKLLKDSFKVEISEVILFENIHNFKIEDFSKMLALSKGVRLFHIGIDFHQDANFYNVR